MLAILMSIFYFITLHNKGNLHKWIEITILGSQRKCVLFPLGHL